jgi:hypothetical protein
MISGDVRTETNREGSQQTLRYLCGQPELNQAPEGLDGAHTQVAKVLKDLATHSSSS